MCNKEKGYNESFYFLLYIYTTHKIVIYRMLRYEIPETSLRSHKWLFYGTIEGDICYLLNIIEHPLTM